MDKGLAGYVAIGTALGTLHDERLFVGPFRAYVEERFDLRYHTANRRIVAARVALNIKAAGLPVPSDEDQAYQLHELTPENQVKTWQEVCNRSKQTGVRITTNLIRDTLGKKPQPKSSPTSSDESVATVPETAEKDPEHDGSVVICLQAVGKAVTDLQVAYRAVENVEIAGGEAEHLNDKLNEVHRPRQWHPGTAPGEDWGAIEVGRLDQHCGPTPQGRGKAHFLPPALLFSLVLRKRGRHADAHRDHHGRQDG